MSREQRKLDHIKYALKLGDGPLTNGLENVRSAAFSFYLRF